MATIIISDLQNGEVKTFLYDLNSAHIHDILGTGIFSGIPGLSRGSDVQLTTVYDGINNRETAYSGPFSLYGNKIFSVDFSRTAIYLIV